MTELHPNRYSVMGKARILNNFLEAGAPISIFVFGLAFLGCCFGFVLWKWLLAKDDWDTRLSRAYATRTDVDRLPPSPDRLDRLENILHSIHMKKIFDEDLAMLGVHT